MAAAVFMRYNPFMKSPEILAPAGTPEALRAAVKAGADAVYAGGDLFSARAFAGNFEKNELLKAIDHCHIYGIKIYLAVNTLLKGEEIKTLPGYLEPFYKNGLDAVIVQDFGAAAVIAREFPDLPLHASTQMSISSAFGAELLRQIGFSRVVPARELSLSEIISVKKKVDIEIESFVHGAMCYCYSGKCMFSSFLGGRSGNRGRCAQPCRKRYEYERESTYIMSLKDMCTLENIPGLIQAGIDSFKIEGRMKKPEYVASAVSAYRRAVDAYFEGTWDEAKIFESIDEMRDIYNRGGFSSGYYYMQNGRKMLSGSRPNHTGVLVGKVSRVSPPKVFIKLEKTVNAQDVLDIREAGVELTASAGANAGQMLELNGSSLRKIKPGMEVYRTRNNALIARIREEITDREMVLEADAVVSARTGQPLMISVSDSRTAVHVQGKTVQKAANRATTAAVVEEKMRKTSGTGLRFNVKCEIDNDAFIPMSELNELRRRAAEEFKIALAGIYHR